MTVYARMIAAHAGKTRNQMDEILKDEAARIVDHICEVLAIEPDGFALWPSIHPETGESYHCLTLNDLHIALNPAQIALLRWILVGYDEFKPLDAAAAKERQKVTPKLRFQVLARDDFTCQGCGRSPKDCNIALEVDHILPVSRGGRTHPDNLQTLCEDCNQGKSNEIVLQMIKREYLATPPEDAFYPKFKELQPYQGFSFPTGLLGAIKRHTRATERHIKTIKTAKLFDTFALRLMIVTDRFVILLLVFLLWFTVSAIDASRIVVIPQAVSVLAAIALGTASGLYFYSVGLAARDWRSARKTVTSKSPQGDL